MKKLRIFALAALASTAFYACTSSEESTEETTDEAVALADGTHTISVDGSEVSWKGVMLGVKEHTGTVQLTEGTVEVTDGAITGGSFTVDLGQIVPTDSAYDEESTKEKLVGHLSSPDFFDTANHPTATFVITGSEGTSVMGDLTIRGITHPETVENVEIHSVDGVTNIKGDLTFDRKKYDVSFDVPVKDMVISDDVELQVSVVSMK
ncbi:YceI family protein [Jiulongibacter sp. NS-SX5]|uniref:YceI family protein n=1 Tax=Jiulongibacter sp. NS-SX5 TaxID=3463854 RepID=UPI0040591B20